MRLVRSFFPGAVRDCRDLKDILGPGPLWMGFPRVLFAITILGSLCLRVRGIFEGVGIVWNSDLIHVECQFLTRFGAPPRNAGLGGSASRTQPGYFLHEDDHNVY